MDRLSPAQGKSLLILARNAIKSYLEKGAIIEPDMPLSAMRGVFCTLKTKYDVLRGCIGLPYPVKPLEAAIIEAAVAAAVDDPRFKPVTVEELADIHIEITVLTVPQLLDCPTADVPKHIEIGKHGLIIESGSAGGLLLPQVAVENGPWKPLEFLEALCWKAGLPPNSWKDKAAKIYTFEGQIFHE